MLVEGGGRGPLLGACPLAEGSRSRSQSLCAEPWAGDGAAASPLTQGRLRPPWGGLCPAVLGTWPLPTPGLRVRAHFSWQLSWAEGQVNCR